MKPAARTTATNCSLDDYQTGTPPVLEFGYDEMNRLVSIGGTGSASFVYDGDGSGGSVLRQLYKAWGETRGSGRVATEYGYTGQYGYGDEFGLLFYRTRWYDPYLNRWIQPDTIVPESTQGVQAWDRYAYTNNNPVKFTDSTGHFVDPVTLAIGGAVIGFVGNVGFQMIGSYLDGNSDSVSEAFASVDWKEACTYGVAGAVAGATYGAINPATTIAGASLAGAVSGAVSGQVAGLFDATWDATANVMSGGEADFSRVGMSAFFDDAHVAGFLDPGQMIFDAATGAFISGAAQGVINGATLPQGGLYVTSAARDAHTALPGVLGSGARTLSAWVQEGVQQLFDSWYSGDR